MKGNTYMKTRTRISYPVFTLFAFACFAAGAGVLGAESIDEGLNSPVQSDTVNASPELTGVETQTVIGLYSPGTRETRLWYMNNNVHVGTVAGLRVPIGWNHAYPVAAADFNGDGHIDVLFFNPITGRTWIGYLFGATQGDYGPTLPSGRQVVATADFNHDGHPDFLLDKNPSLARQTWIWYMNNNIHIGFASGPTLYRFLPLLAVGDFNGDGYPDYLLVQAYVLGNYFILDMHNNVYSNLSQQPPRYPWSIAGATDFSRNGKVDLLLYNSSTRQTAIWYMNNNVHVGTAAGPNIPSGWNLFAP